MSNHTPGPWIPKPITNAAWEIAGPGRKGYAEGIVCMVTTGEANARLIAAAPELLEALRGCFEHGEYSTPYGKAAWDAARAALAKANGEGSR